MKNSKKIAAFTLIELSIVLVIIGLIIGGVLEGKDLIKAAEIRNTISQIKEFNTAANTFRSKYNCLPGDCPNASQFGLGSGTTHVFYSSGNGNGDGLVCAPVWPDGSECINFWHHLNTAGLLKTSFTEYGSSVPCFFPGFHSPTPPIAKPYSEGLGCGNVTVGIKGGWGVLEAHAFSSITQSLAGYSFSPLPYIGRSYIISPNQNLAGSTTTGLISPNNMRAVDMKIDDGVANTGNVFAILAQMIGTGAVTPTYNQPYSGGNYPTSDDLDQRNLVIRAGF